MPPLPYPLAGMPPLPFGQAAATTFGDEARCGEFLARLPDAPRRVGAIGPARNFRISLRNVSLPGVSLLAGSSSPKATDHCSRRLTLVIPFGHCESVLRVGRVEHRWAAPHHAYFIPAGEPIEAESTTGSFLRLDIVETALVRVAAGMRARKAASPRTADLSAARIVPMVARGVHWQPVVRSFCSTVDGFDCDPQRLAAAGLDDMILRTVVMMLQPELFFEQQWPARDSRGFSLDPLLERIEANLAGRVTLSDMEAWSGRTARSIQLAFQKRFGMGPMQWLRDKRLDLVRAKLLAAPAGATIREIAASCGLHRMATLIPEYTRRFGERPSDTLRRMGFADGPARE